MKIRDKDCVCEIPQHNAVLGDEKASAAAPRVPAGPIAVLPENHDDNTIGGSQVFRDAVVNAGGDLQPLGPDTRGLVWLSYTKSAQLGDVLAANPQLNWVQLPWAGV
ncbi:MAG: hypothetical protein RL720_674, partial [Actinomycetota bacterium]